VVLGPRLFDACVLNVRRGSFFNVVGGSRMCMLGKIDSGGLQQILYSARP
jgi:hypothetical protein